MLAQLLVATLMDPPAIDFALLAPHTVSATCRLAQRRRKWISSSAFLDSFQTVVLGVSSFFCFQYPLLEFVILYCVDVGVTGIDMA